MSDHLMRAVHNELAAGEQWDRWVKSGGSERLARLKDFFALEASVPRHPARFETRHMPNGAAYQLAIFPQHPSPAGSAPALTLQRAFVNGRSVFRLAPLGHAHSATQ